MKGRSPIGRRRGSLAPLVCGLAVAAALFALSWNRPFGLADEGFLYLLSRGWARGEDLYRHYQLLYPTGQYAWFGSLLYALGESLWVLRLGGSLLGGAAAALIFGAVRRESGPLVAWPAAWAGALAGVGSAATLASSVVFAGALDLARRRAPGRRWVLAAAAVAGALVAWREDSAVLALGLSVVAVALRRRPRELVTLVVPGVVAGLAPWFGLAWLRGELVSLAGHLAHRLAFLVERLPTPDHAPWAFVSAWPRTPRELGAQLLPLAVLVPPLLYGGLLLGELRRHRSGLGLDRPRLAAALVGVLYLPQFLWERPDFFHFRAHVHLLVAVAAVAVVRLHAPVRRRAAALFATVAVAAAGGLLLQHRLARPVPYPCCGGARIGASLEGGAPPWAGLPRRSGETLIVLDWGPGWYVVEGLDPGTRFLYTTPRHLPTPALAQRLVEDIEHPDNRWVLEQRGAWRPPGVQPVLERRYRPAGTWRGWKLWARRR